MRLKAFYGSYSLHLAPACPSSTQTRLALKLLGQLIKVGRGERRISSADLAKRAGISRSLLHRIERGDPTCGIGAVFETAAIVGVPFFDEDVRGLASTSLAAERRLALLPKSVRATRSGVKDDF